MACGLAVPQIFNHAADARSGRKVAGAVGKRPDVNGKFFHRWLVDVRISDIHLLNGPCVLRRDVDEEPNGSLVSRWTVDMVGILMLVQLHDITPYGGAGLAETISISI